MIELLQEIAEYLADQDLVVYDPDGTGDETGNVFIERMPDEPIEAVGIFSARSSQPTDARNGRAYPGVRIEVRAGGGDPRTAAAWAAVIHDALHFQHETELVTDGIWVHLCLCTLPVRGRTDDTGAYTYSFTADIITRE